MIPVCKSPQDVMSLLSDFSYGWLDSELKPRYTFDNWFESFRLPAIHEIYESKIGTCYEQSLLAYYIFKRDLQQYPLNLVHIQQYGASTHMYLLYKDADYYNWFEHAFADFSGIHTGYTSIQSSTSDVYQAMESQEKGVGGYRWIVVDFNRFHAGMTAKDFYSVVEFNYSYD